MPPTRQVVPYYGSKQRIAQWIIGNFPAESVHWDHYAETNFGSGAVFFNKAPSRMETVNDLYGPVTIFFRVLRDQSEELIQAIHYTPYSREEFTMCRETFKNDFSHLDELEIARRFYTMLGQGRSASVAQRTSWKVMKQFNRAKTCADYWNDVSQLEAAVSRLKNAQIERMDTIKFIQKYDTKRTLFYVDPPYLPQSRSKNWLKSYGVEVSEDWHIDLADTLDQIKGFAIVSGYQSEVYSWLYESRGWERRGISERTNNPKKKSTESIWLSPRVCEAAYQPRLL